ncbi:hypothetical protein MferCBS49748_005377 [Microsporum ferrugineum]
MQLLTIDKPEELDNILTESVILYAFWRSAVSSAASAVIDVKYMSAVPGRKKITDERRKLHNQVEAEVVEIFEDVVALDGLHQEKLNYPSTYHSHFQSGKISSNGQYIVYTPLLL